MTAAALANNIAVLSSPFDTGAINLAVPTPTQMAQGFTPNVDVIKAEQQNYLHNVSSSFVYLAQLLGLALPFNPVAGASVVATPAGGVVSLKDSVSGATQFYVALNNRAIGYTDPSADPTNWAMINFQALAKLTDNYADATGTADALLASYPNVPYPVLLDGFGIIVGIASPNLTTTPTLAVTLNGNVLTARTIWKFVGNVAVALAPGDIQGDAEFRYDLPNTRWILQNPSISTASPKLPTVTGAVAANALTIGVSSQWLDFRSATLGSGAISSVFCAPANLVVPSGATLGTVNAILSRLVVVEMNNGGIAEIAVANISGGLQMDETNLITTTAITAGATAANVWYSTTARASLPYRVIGYIESTQAAAGAWATAPSTIQGAGGNALTALNSSGYGQNWQALTITSGVTQYNIWGKPVDIYLANSIAGISVIVNGYTVTPSTNSVFNAYFRVPPGQSFSATGTLTTASILR